MPDVFSLRAAGIVCFPLLTQHAHHQDAQSADQHEHAGENNDEADYVLSPAVHAAPPIDHRAVSC